MVKVIFFFIVMCCDLYLFNVENIINIKNGMLVDKLIDICILL